MSRGSVRSSMVIFRTLAVNWVACRPDRTSLRLREIAPIQLWQSQYITLLRIAQRDDRVVRGKLNRAG